MPVRNEPEQLIDWLSLPTKFMIWKYERNFLIKIRFCKHDAALQRGDTRISLFLLSAFLLEKYNKLGTVLITRKIHFIATARSETTDSGIKQTPIHRKMSIPKCSAAQFPLATHSPIFDVEHKIPDAYANILNGVCCWAPHKHYVRRWISST